MLKVVSVSDTMVNYNGHKFKLGSVASANIEEYPATFPLEMEVNDGDYLDNIVMDLTTACVNGKYIHCVRIREAEIKKHGELDKYIPVTVTGLLLKPKNLGDECPRVGLDAREQIRFTLKSRDAYNRYVSRPAFSKKVAREIFKMKNHTLITVEALIMPDALHKFILCVRKYKIQGGNE